MKQPPHSCGFEIENNALAKRQPGIASIATTTSKKKQPTDAARSDKPLRPVSKTSRLFLLAGLLCLDSAAELLLAVLALLAYRKNAC